MKAAHKIAVFAVAAWLGLAGCAVQNQFSGSVAGYNTETERAQDIAVLLNALRASKRRPLTFFDITSVSGASPASGSIGLSLPLSQNGTTSRVATTVTPMVALSGGPTVTAAPVVTQEFYKGILAPLPKSTIDLFVQRGISRDLLYNLLFDRITISSDASTGGAGAFHAVVVNSPGDDLGSARFQRLVEILVDLGLTTRKTNGEATVYGPIYLPSDLSGSNLVARATAAGLEVDAVNWCDLDLNDRLELAGRLHGGRRIAATVGEMANLCATIGALHEKLAQTPPDNKRRIAWLKAGEKSLWIRAAAERGIPANVYRLEKTDPTPGAEFCFEPLLATDPGAPPSATSACEAKSGPATAHGRPAEGLMALRAPFIDLRGEQGLCAALFAAPQDSGRRKACESADPDQIAIAITPRSTYSVMYYLGAVVRRWLYPDPKAGNDPGGKLIRLRIVQPQGREAGAGCTPYSARAEHCTPLFWVDQGAERGFLSVRYDGATYVIPATAAAGELSERSDMTYEVMDIVTEIVDLNRSSKDLPASSVFTLQGLP
ncbi:MAG TPA: hypothetical protein VII63_08235 [Caulobacteraceae bacterium]